MKQQVNYIAHHKAVNIKIMEDDLSSTHVSLYNALFLIWNECGFETELSINRNDVMKLSKIGSANTYTSALKELDKRGYLKYYPSHNPLIGSKINLYRFDNSSDKTTDKSTDNSSVKSSSKSTDNSTDTLSKQLNFETIKLINNNIELVNKNLKKWIEKETPKNKSFIPPTMQEIDIYRQAYNQNKGHPTLKFKEQVERFYDHYSANGWKQSNGNAIKDWESAFRGWVTRSETFNNGNHGSSAKNNTKDPNDPFSAFTR